MILQDLCIHCGFCLVACPLKAIANENGTMRIRPEACTLCGLCAGKCLGQAIVLAEEEGGRDP